MINTNSIHFLDKGIYTGGDRTRKNYIPNPSSYSVTESDIDLNSKRSTSGYLNRNRVRKDVYSVECVWDKLSRNQVNLLRYASSPKDYRFKFRWDLLNENTGAVIDKYTTCEHMYTDANRTFEQTSTESDGVDYWTATLTFIEY